MGRMVKRKRAEDAISGRALEKLLQISASTISRIESGGGDRLGAEEFLRIIFWLGLDPQTFLPRVARTKTMMRIETLLENDPDLSKRGKDILIGIVKILYKELRKGGRDARNQK